MDPIARAIEYSPKLVVPICLAIKMLNPNDITPTPIAEAS